MSLEDEVFMCEKQNSCVYKDHLIIESYDSLSGTYSLRVSGQFVKQYKTDFFGMGGLIPWAKKAIDYALENSLKEAGVQI